MSVEVRWEQCCESQGCTRPARHGALCVACFLGATPARRAAELLAAAPVIDELHGGGDCYVSHRGAAWLEALWAA